MSEDLQKMLRMWRSEFALLRPYGGAALIMADPPWLYELRSKAGEGKSPQAHYECMPTEHIKAMPVSLLAAEDCLLWLWATHPMVPDALDVCSAWGFEYSTSGVWIKRTKNWKLNFGGGYRLRSSSEPFIIASRGKPLRGSRSVRTVIEARIREHSRKPDEAYKNAEAMCAVDGPYVDLFSRENRPKWTAWGNEAGKFNRAA